MGDLDTVFRALANERRYQALICVKEHRTVSLADLAEVVVEEQLGKDVTGISGERVRDVYFSLYHKHVPLLERADLIHYEQEEDLVEWVDGANRPLVQARDRVNSLVVNR